MKNKLDMRTNQQRLLSVAMIGALVTLLLLGCASIAPDPRKSDSESSKLMPRAAASAPRLATESSAAVPALSSIEPNRDRSRDQVFIGTGELVKLDRKAPPVDAAAAGPSDISLSFENGDIREIVKNILGDLLGENYIIDPRVQGVITIRTARPVPKSSVFSLLENILRINKFALVRDGAYVRVLPESESIRGIVKPSAAGTTSLTRGDGATVVIYAAKFVGAKELQRVIEPFARDAAAMRVDDLRNILFLTGTQQEIARLLELCEMFDINLMAGMSFGLFTLQRSEVKTVMEDWRKIFTDQFNPLAGLVRILPIERMNALLIISPQPQVIAEAQRWLEQLDKGGDAGSGQKLFVYVLQYTQAEKLQAVLQSVISGRPSTTTSATVAPGQTANALSSPPVRPISGQPIVQPGNSQPVVSATTTSTTSTAPQSLIGAAGSVGTGPGAGSPIARNANVVADKDRNALLIVATQAEYNAIETVIKKLDIPPKQVAIEVQIAEVLLTGDFQFGLQSYFAGKLESSQNRLTSENGFGSIVKGAFSYTWRKTDAIQAVLNLSESNNKIRTISQPTLITLENQKASFGAGTQISVRTQTSTTNAGTIGSTDSFQYIDTGISINVTPRVSGENVFLEIQQQLSDAGIADAGNPNPPITKRDASTSVMVRSGDTMLMGGLFQEGSRNNSSGFPVLSTIPVLGGLFGSQRWQSNRSELVLLITPTIISTPEDSRLVIDDLRKGFTAIESFGGPESRAKRPTSIEEKREMSKALQGINGSLKMTDQFAPASGSQ